MRCQLLRIVRRVALFMIVFVAALWLLSLWYSVVIGVPAGDGKLMMVTHRYRIRVIYFGTWRDQFSAMYFGLGREPFSARVRQQTPEENTLFDSAVPSFTVSVLDVRYAESSIVDSWELGVPYWLPLAMAGMVYAPLRLWAPDIAARRRRKHGQCVKCGYDLRGSAATCPECGAPVNRGGTHL